VASDPIAESAWNAGKTFYPGKLAASTKAALPLIGRGARDADLEIPLRISDDFSIAGMVGGFNCHYSTTDLRIMFANIFGEFDLRARRSKDQQLAGIRGAISDQ
jgi:hypothetical protein